jgi:6-phosphofructokinase 1
MMSMSSRNLMIVQSGGPTAVFNASLASIISEAHLQPSIGKIYGARFGMRGLVSNEIVDLTSLSEQVLDDLRHSPGAALGSSRYTPSESDMDCCIEVLRSRDVGCMIFLGGNGTMAGAQRFREFCASRSFDLQVMGSPKTIDNDISSTDRCPGFGSAARYIAQSTIDLAMDIRSLPQPISIFETLGRDVGWLAASSLVAKQSADEAPHLICIPEIPFVQDEFLQRLHEIVQRIGWAVVVVSEGTCHSDGSPVFQQELSSGGDTPMRPLIGGVAQHLSGVVAKHLGLRCRSEKPGLVGRSSVSYRSHQDVADAEITGRECVRALVDGKTGSMISLRPLGESGSSAFELVPLEIAAGLRRALPPQWLAMDGLGVNEQFLRYVKPIVGPLRRYEVPLSSAHRV